MKNFILKLKKLLDIIDCYKWVVFAPYIDSLTGRTVSFCEVSRHDYKRDALKAAKEYREANPNIPTKDVYVQSYISDTVNQ